MENEKAMNKLTKLVMMTNHFNTWEYQKKAIKSIIDKHINNAYMIDQRYYKEYINLYHDMLIMLNEL